MMERLTLLILISPDVSCLDKGRLIGLNRLIQVIKRSIKVVVWYPDEEDTTKWQIYFSTDDSMSTKDVIDCYRTRFQLEFFSEMRSTMPVLTTSTDLRNASFLASISPRSPANWGIPFSISSLQKSIIDNDYMVNGFICVFGLQPKSYKKMLDISQISINAFQRQVIDKRWNQLKTDMLTTYFPRNETRGNKYFYGEIHIANQKIKLNSARDGLAPTPEAECLKCLIRNFFDGLVKLYHLANDTKKAVERYIDAYKIIQAPATENIVNAQKQLTDACKKLKSITKSKNATNPVAQKVLESYKRRIKDLHTEMDQEIPCIPASELPISSPIPQVEPELDDFEILNNHYPEDLAALIRRVCMSYQRNCPVSHIKLIRELQRKAIRELIEE